MSAEMVPKRFHLQQTCEVRFPHGKCVERLTLLRDVAEDILPTS